jgi:hypothetical protein
MSSRKSLGNLTPVDQPTERHPRFIGKIKLHTDLLSYLQSQLSETEADEVVCNLAGWINDGPNGRFITVELSPRFVSKQQRTLSASDVISEMLEQ